MIGPFEYVMVLVSIIIGLGVTHVLTALGAAVNRLRGHGSPIRLDATYLLWIGFVLTWMIQFWWFEFRFQSLDVTWTFGLYLFLIAYAVSLFLMAVILVPSDMEGVADSYQFFMDGRKWFFGAVIIAQLLDIADTFLKGFDWGSRPTFLILAGSILVMCVVGMAAKGRSAQLAAASAGFLIQMIYGFQELGILAS